ncbi:unnamed protein product [Ectocarpus sp. CCAP 1310/34]|nr:unnamed protein product [Ectocarpus sp. CCAP 1310/34]
MHGHPVENLYASMPRLQRNDQKPIVAINTSFTFHIEPIRCGNIAVLAAVQQNLNGILQTARRMR